MIEDLPHFTEGQYIHYKTSSRDNVYNIADPVFAPPQFYPAQTCEEKNSRLPTIRRDIFLVKRHFKGSTLEHFFFENWTSINFSEPIVKRTQVFRRSVRLNHPRAGPLC